jgi:hypothetical protein
MAASRTIFVGVAKALKSRNGTTGKSGRYNVLGTTKDGVRILKPKGEATHFTRKEVREAVAQVRAAKR